MVEGADRPDDGVLTPDELDVSEREDVRELDDNRYFVSLDSGAAPEFERLDEREEEEGDDLVAELASTPETYGLALAAKTESGVEERVIASNSVVETFEHALVWYAAQVGDADTPPEDVLRILLEESSLDV
jgi:hypothetical protein